MHRSFIAILLILAAAALWACDNGTGVDSDPDAILGSWISAGNDVAPGLQHRDSILTEFDSAGTWISIEYTGEYGLDRAGVYQLGEGDGPVYPITILAEPPSEDTLGQGIYRVDGDRLQLEVAFRWMYGGDLVPPTVESGFGSTLADSVETGPYWIQIYERWQ